MRIDGAVGQLDANVDMCVLRGVLGAAPVVVEKIALADLEGDIDGVLADDRCKLAGGGLDQIALGEDGEPDPSIDGRADLRIAEVDLRLIERPKRPVAGERFAQRRCYRMPRYSVRKWRLSKHGSYDQASRFS
jgi:hypothetical protein